MLCRLCLIEECTISHLDLLFSGVIVVCCHSSNDRKSEKGGESELANCN